MLTPHFRKIIIQVKLDIPARPDIQREAAEEKSDDAN